MSHYTFRTWFTGLVHFVENKDPNAKCQLCVVMPRADQNPYHRGHTGAIYEVSREPFCGKLRLRPGSLIGPYLDRHRIVFKITRTDDVPPEPADSPSFPYGFLHLQDIAGIFADENDRIVSVYPPPPPEVLAQILVEGGYRFGYDDEISVLRWWNIPSTLTGYPLRLEIADPVFVEIPNVEKVEVLFYSLDGDETVIYSEVLRPGSNGFIEIMAANSCRATGSEYCLLGWEDLDFQWRGGNYLEILQIDRDFEFHYRLLHPSTVEAIKKVLPKKHQELPEEPRYPVPESPLVEVRVAPHICLEDFFRPRPGPSPGPDEARQWRERSTEDRAADIVRRWFPDAGVEFFKFLVGILVVVFGTGTGSGNDCLGTKAQARFVDLDRFIPAPEPAVSVSVLHKRAALDRRMCFPSPGDPGYPFLKKPEEKSTEKSAEKSSPETHRD
jgi:hypothetical protein